MHVYLFFLSFLCLVVISIQWLVLWYLRKRERVFFKDIIVIRISVHNRGRIEIEKRHKKRIYWSNTHWYRIQIHTHIAACPTRPKTVNKSKELLSQLLPSSPDFRIFKYGVVALQQIHSLLVGRVLAKYCLATKGISRRGGGDHRRARKQCRKPQNHNCCMHS